MKLPSNPSAADYQKYFDSLSPSQQIQFKKAGLLGIINQFYKDRATDVTQDDKPVTGALASGVFSDARRKEFRFKLIKQGDSYDIEYQPVDAQKMIQEQSKNAENK